MPCPCHGMTTETHATMPPSVLSFDQLAPDKPDVIAPVSTYGPRYLIRSVTGEAFWKRSRDTTAPLVNNSGANSVSPSPGALDESPSDPPRTG